MWRIRRRREHDREQEHTIAPPPSGHSTVGSGHGHRRPTVWALVGLDLDHDGTGVGSKTHLLNLQRRFLGRPDQIDHLVASIGLVQTADERLLGRGEEVADESVRSWLDDLEVDAERSGCGAPGWTDQTDRPAGAIAE